jgi:hypothetical protein
MSAVLLTAVGFSSPLSSREIDVLVYQGRQPGDIFRLHGRSLGAELMQSRINIERVPEDDNIHHETECAKLVFLPLTVALAQFTPLRERRLFLICGGPLHDSVA